MRIAALLLLVLAPLTPALALIPVAEFDLNRYQGTWYEIASIPGFLQSRCALDTSVDYTAAENGAMAAQTRCTRADGSTDSSESRVRPLDPATPAVLKVTAVQFLGIWWYPLGRESIVIAVGPDYRWIVVGHPSLRYGRITFARAVARRQRSQARGGGIGRGSNSTCASSSRRRRPRAAFRPRGCAIS